MCQKLYAAYALSVLVPILTRIALQILLNEGGFDPRKTQVFAISSHSGVVRRGASFFHALSTGGCWLQDPQM